MAKVLRTSEAEDSLLEIGRYIAQKTQSLQRAFDVLNRIDEKCELYSGFPMAGSVCDDLGPGLRYFPVDSYVVIYRPLNDGIRVLLAAHGHQDIPEVFHRLFPNE